MRLHRNFWNPRLSRGENRDPKWHFGCTSMHGLWRCRNDDDAKSAQSQRKQLKLNLNHLFCWCLFTAENLLIKIQHSLHCFQTFYVQFVVGKKDLLQWPYTHFCWFRPKSYSLGSVDSSILYFILYYIILHMLQYYIMHYHSPMCRCVPRSRKWTRRAHSYFDAPWPIWPFLAKMEFLKFFRSFPLLFSRKKQNRRKMTEVMFYKS